MRHLKYCAYHIRGKERNISSSEKGNKFSVDLCFLYFILFCVSSDALIVSIFSADGTLL